ncbi:MAG: UDP-3-O-(3-hydroxymyristoyl)glucosamine N-acyltransferase [Cellvibrio sp.]|uniref:UDP-3-O-(3-hydroxymyristoyl)glucosamine N-acyltransferase n=1 Tax=Cellvibrio sp. TaxID=1965322 RepID=UPI00271DA880|nr:UDP-3-O-(3-hydroxymyristoyl)glucosamine N-acyltransferase [Cellvibrio sp.]
MAIHLGQIVQALGGRLHGDANALILGLAPLKLAIGSDISFVSNPKYEQQLSQSLAGCVIVSPRLEQVAVKRGACIVTEQPYLYFALLTQLWKQQHRPKSSGHIHPSAVIEPTALIDPSAVIGPLCVVERHAQIGANTVLNSRVTVGENCVVGAHCILHSGVVIGADGFGFAPKLGDDGQKSWVKIEQLGAVHIGNHVEIGANTCVDRGALQDTIIEEGVKLDNLIQIGHNVRIGKHTVIAASTAVAGSADIGAFCTIGGSVSIAGHLSVADHVEISGASVVTHSVHKPGVYTGLFPLDDNAAWSKNAATLKQLFGLRERIRMLEKKLEIIKE